MLSARLQEVELLVLVDDLLREAVGVERLALQGEDGLRLHVAAGGERAGGGVALDDEERALLGALVLVAEMQAAVAQLAVVERGLLRALAGEAADAGELLALVLALLDLALERLGRLRLLVQVGVELCCTNLPMKSRIGGPPGPMSVEPSLVFVCDSKTGSITRTAIAATIDWRTSAASKSFL